jgi:DNA-binding transcriptional MerR regulator
MQRTQPTSDVTRAIQAARQRAPIRPPAVPDRRYTSNEILRMFPSLTARMLQWWTERGAVKTQLVGHRRLYSYQNLITIAITHRLRRADLPLQRVRLIVPRILAEWTANPLNSQYVVVYYQSARYVRSRQLRIAVLPDPAALADSLLEETSPILAVFSLSRLVQQIWKQTGSKPEVNWKRT